MLMILWCRCSGAQLRKILETKENFGGFYHGFIVCADSPKANGGTQNLKTGIIHMTLASTLSFCYKSRSSRKTLPLYWLATNNNTRRNTKRKRFERKSKTNTQRKTKHREIDCREKLDQMGLQ